MPKKPKDKGDKAAPESRDKKKQGRGASKRLPSIPSEGEESPAPSEAIVQAINLSAIDSKYSWLVVFCSFFCNMIVDGMQYTFANFLQPIQSTFGATVMAVSLIGSLMSGFYNFCGPLAGALANKFGFRMVVITGSLVAAFGLSVSYFATDVGVLYFTYGILGGLGFGMVYMAAVITTSLYFDKYRALATSISVCGTGVGTFIFSPLGNFLVGYFGWRMALVVEAGIVLTCILFGLSFKPIDAFSYTVATEEADLGTTSLSTIRTVKTILGSSTMPEHGRPLHNKEYPTLKQALMLTDDDGRRSTYSAYPKSGRASAVPSVGQSLIMRPVISLSVESETDGNKCSKCCSAKCKMRCRNCCCNFWSCRCHAKKELTAGDRPLYRDDVFYEGSLSYLPHYSKGDPINYHLSVIRMPHERDAEEHMRQKCCGCHEAMLRACVTMTGIHLLKNKTFFFLCLSSFMYTMGVFIPYIFIRQLAEEKKINEDKSVWLVSAIGVANTVGRIFCGLLMNWVRIKPAMLVLACTIATSVVCLMVLLPVVVETVFIFATTFGFFSAPFVSLRPVVIVEFLGLDKLTNAFGLVLLSQGVASILGPPLAGLLNEATGETRFTILFAGSLLLASSISILVSIILAKKS